MKVPVWIPCLLFCLRLANGQYPPLYPGPNPSPRPNQQEHRLPVDQPQQVEAHVARPRMNMAQLKHDADELAKLMQGIPPEIEKVEKGQLPKDLVERLKSIEKLSKHLRRELYP